MSKIKTIDVTAKEWRDKVNGNSYFAGKVTINYAMPDEKTFVMPFQYGYGEQYLYESGATLRRNGFNTIPETNLTRYARENGIILRHSIQKNCLKRELKEYAE